MITFKTVFTLILAISFYISVARAESFGWSGDGTYRADAHLTPQDYLYAPNPERKNDLFETLRPAELGVDLGVGSDCGKINIDGTLKSAYGKFLSGDYFKGMAQDILAGAPMLAACYMSPTWCAILKHTQLSANFLTQTRLNQCQIMDKYTDSRVEDYYRERQTCIHKSIEANGGDMDNALASCQNGIFDRKAGQWAGKSDDPNAPNALLADSAKWAGFSGAEGDRINGLLKSMVGDTIVAKGNVRVDYGTQAHAYSPRSYLLAMQENTTQDFCGKLLPSLASGDKYVTDEEIQAQLNALPVAPGEEESPSITPDVIRSLSYLPPSRRDRICLKLSQTLATQSFARDMNRALDVLTVAAQNPNLPPNRKAEIEQKRQSLKDQVDLTLKLRQEQAKPIGEAMQYISSEGLAAQDEATRSNIAIQSGMESKSSHNERMNDCADGVFCGSGP